MKNILFDDEGAIFLNQLIQEKVAGHLFVVCNYNPVAFEPINDDARFLQGISNLYKFAIDCSLINRLKRIDDSLGGICSKNNRRDFNNYKKCLDDINALRTYTDHNNFHNEFIVQVELWIQKVTKKKKLESMRDYTLALRELENLAEKTFDLSRTIINALVNTYPKDDLQNAFQDEIVYFYKNNTRIIENELKQLYRSQMACPEIVKNGFIADWCLKKYCGQYEETIRKLSAFREYSEGKDIQKIETAIAEYENQLTAIKHKVADNSKTCKGNIDKLSVYDYLEYYKKDVVKRILSSLSEIKNHGYTMLPQDMIQFFISRDFQGITIDMD